MPPQSFGALKPKIEVPRTDDGKDLPGGKVDLKEKESEVFDLEKDYQSLFDESGNFKFERLEGISSVYHNEIVVKLIEAGEGDLVALRLSFFKDLNQNVALKLIDAGKSDYIINHISSFSDIYHNEIALKLSEEAYPSRFARNLSSFKELSKKVAFMLIDDKRYLDVAGNLSSFNDIDHNEIVNKIIDVYPAFFHYEFPIKDLNQGIAFKMIELGHGDFVVNNISYFNDANHNDIAYKLIEKGYASQVSDNLLNFNHLNKKIAFILAEKGFNKVVIKHLSNFEDININELILELADKRIYGGVNDFLSLVGGFDEDLAFELIKRGASDNVIHRLSSFKEPSMELALRLIVNYKGKEVARDIDSFKNIDFKEFAKQLYERNVLVFLVEYHQLFGLHLKDVPFLGDIYKLQPPSNNEDNDSWKKHLIPLLARAFGEDAFGGDPTADNDNTKKEVIKYIKNFGLVYIPHLFDIFHVVFSYKDISEEVKGELRAFGINPNLQRDAILLELNKVAKGYVKNILNGEVPESLDTNLGNALFIKEFVPQSTFDRGYSNWKELGIKAKETYTVPSYIKTQEIELLEKGEMNELDADVLCKKRQEVFENKETVTRFEAFKGYIQDTNNGFTIFNVQEAIRKRIESQQDLIAKKDKEKDAKVIESIKKAIDKDLLLLKNLEEVVLGVTGEGSLAKNSAMYARLVELSSERNNKEENLNRFLRAYALTDIMETNQGLKTLFNSMLAKDTIDADSLRILSDFTSHSIDHEYLDRQESGFSEVVKIRIRTLLMANKVYNISPGKDGGDMSLDYFTKIVKDLEKIDNPTENSIVSKVSFVPVGGLGRLTAGNVGDACYTLQTDRLADGHFQNTHMMMITKESKDGSEHIVGSMLGIQAQEVESGVPVYVIRANNPQENYLSSVDVDSYVEASVQACVQQAVDIRNENVTNGSGGDIKVCMPMEACSNASMTNRPRVHERMYKKFSLCEKVGLNSNDDTNFNGYNIWNEAAWHAVVCIYEIKNGVEYYYGKHAEEKQHDLFDLYNETEVVVPEWKNKLEQIKNNVLRPR